MLGDCWSRCLNRGLVFDSVPESLKLLDFDMVLVDQGEIRLAAESDTNLACSSVIRHNTADVQGR